MSSGSQDVMIRIQGRRATGYPVHAALDDGGVFEGDDLVIPEQDLLKFELDAAAYGLLLGQRLFSPPILRALERAAGDASQDEDVKLRVRLCISRDAAELHYYAWERVFINWLGQSTPISANGSLVFSRFLELELAEENPLESRPLRISVAISNPNELPAGMSAIDVEQELKRLADILAAIPDTTVSFLPGRTPVSAQLMESLKAQKIALIAGSTTLAALVDLAGNCDVLHILSHGAWNRQGAETEECAKLFLEDEEGGFAKAIDTDLATRISALAAKPRVLFLAACDSATLNLSAPSGNSLAPPVGLGSKLVAAGIPAVVAMQREVGMETAGLLAAKFYASVLDHGEVDLALSEARLSLYQTRTPEWAIPVMFLRIRHGRLFSADPVHTALRNVASAYVSKPDFEYIPIEAARLNTPDLIRDWERASNESVSSVDLWGALQDFATSAGDRQVLALIGDAGTGKSLYLDRLAAALANATCAAGPKRIFPVCVDVRAYHDISAIYCTKLEELIFRSIQRLTPLFPRTIFDDILESSSSAHFCLLFDEADALADSVRLEIFQAVAVLAARHPQHRYIVALDCRYFDPAAWSPSELLAIRLLTPRLVERFLHQDPRPAAAELFKQIVEVNLFDLASIPWLLLYMHDMALRGAVLRSRSAVLSNVVERRLITVSVEQGLRSRARNSLFALAWLMQSLNRETVTLDEAFGVFRKVQNLRDYSLESLLQELAKLNCGLLVLGQPETVRFAYPALQHYCAARYLSDNPDVDMDRVTDTLGRPERMRWWQPVLVLYSSMAANPLPFFESILLGGSLTQGEQLFLLSRCLLEISWRTDGPTGTAFASSPYLAMSDQIYSALQWRARRVNESSWMVRQRAVQALGRWRRTEAISFLCEIALKPVPLRGKDPAYEYSQVRIAAARALRRAVDRTAELTAADPAVPPLLAAWLAHNVYTLEEMLNSAVVGVQGLAAFALGDIGDEASQKALFTAFSAEHTDPATLWAIVDAFLEMEPAPVLGEFKRLIEVAECEWHPTYTTRVPLYERLVYLLGEMRTDFPGARPFIESFLTKPATVVLKGRAMIALGKLRASDWLPVWEEVAMGTLTKLHIEPVPDAAQTLFLRRKAIEAIGEMGSLESLISIRRRQAWDADLDEALFWATERTVTASGASWRSNGKQGETYDGAKRLYPGRLR